MAELLTRRAFFAKCRPTAPKPELLANQGEPPDLSALFLEAMRLGIDPATVAPAELRACIAAKGNTKNG